jgi:MFS family permease
MPTPPRIAIRRLAAARAISVTGSEATFIALMVAIYSATHSTLWLSAAPLLVIGAQGVFAPLLGALGDAVDRRRVMIGSELCTAAVTGAMALTGAPAALVGLAFLGAVAQSPFFSASTAAIPNLVGDGDVTWANSRISIGRNAGALVGPVLGGAAAALLGPRFVFAANALLVAGSAATIATVRGTFADPRRRDGHRLDLRAGFRFVANEPVLRLVTLAWIVLLGLLGPVLVAELPLARSFGMGALGYGLISACWGGGAIVGSFLGPRIVRRDERRAMVAGCAVIGGGLATVAVAPAFTVVLLGMTAAGVAEGTVTVAEEGILQRRTPDALRSRATAATEAAAMGAYALSLPTAGVVIGAVGIRGAYLLAAVACAAAALILVAAMRALDTSGCEMDPCFAVGRLAASTDSPRAG